MRGEHATTEDNTRIPTQKRSNRKSGERFTGLVRAGCAICLLLARSASAAVTISPDHPELLQQGILAAYAAGQKSVVVPAASI
jgi:hypothetical protein